MASPSEPASVAERLRASLDPVLDGPVEVEDLQRLSGGASRETWAFRSDGRDLILRRDPPGRPTPPGSMRAEADVMRACRRRGLRAPEVLLDDDGTTLGTAGLVMGRVLGESLARKVLRDDRFEAARKVLLGQVAEFMVGLHSIDPDEVPGAPDSDELARYRAAYDVVDDRSPVFEKAFEWLEANRPARSRTSLVHGDLRMGNVIVDEEGLAAVIDWEFIHRGDPLEDLAWFCVKAWRFGSPLDAGGVGTVDELIALDEEASGTEVDPAVFHWWLVQKTLMWGVICMGQAWAHLAGLVRSHELAAIGRRVAEQEWDLVELLAPDAHREAAAEALPDRVPDDPGVYGRPTARELLDAVRAFLTEDVMLATSGRLSFHARVAANVLGIVERELAHPPVDPGGDDWPSLARVVRAKLAVANPKYLDA
jgi:aminoglycoside phosphotransferase (APT) family kinase protein